MKGVFVRKRNTPKKFPPKRKVKATKTGCRWGRGRGGDEKVKEGKGTTDGGARLRKGGEVNHHLNSKNTVDQKGRSQRHKEGGVMTEEKKGPKRLSVHNTHKKHKEKMIRSIWQVLSTGGWGGGKLTRSLKQNGKNFGKPNRRV